MEIAKFSIGDYKTNCYVIHDNGDAIVIDPGYDSEELIQYLKENLLSVEAVYITHGHFDHVGGVNQLKSLYQCKVYAPEKDKIWLGKSSYNRLGYPILVDTWVVHGDEILVFGHVFKVYETPGHTEGSTALYVKGHLFSGDTLFFESIGRTDLPLSNPNAIINSVKRMYQWFDDDTIVYPGHGKTSSIQHEKAHNPFVSDSSY
jgi:hydroxyacylglutathione hydrolase